jgi:Flp pilus assembly protein TadG
VELVLLLPVLLLMIFGLVDFALAFTAHTRLRNAVAEGGYYAAQNPGDVAGVRAQIRSALGATDPPLEDGDITITECVPDGDDFEVEISVSYAYPMLFGLFGAGPEVELRNSTTVPQFGGCH